MRILLTFLLLQCNFIFLIANSEISLPVTSATIYEAGATVKRTGVIQLSPGENTIKITGLPLDLDKTTLNVYIENDALILSQKIRREYFDVTSISSQFESEKTAIADSLEYLNTMVDVLNKQEQILDEHTNLTTFGEKFSSEEVSKLRANYAQEMKELKEQIIAIKLHKRGLRNRLQDINKKISEESEKISQGSSEIFLTVLSDKEDNPHIELSYFIKNAGWQPTYDLKVGSIDQPLELVYKASVFQNTDEDWEDVSISLSSAFPDFNYHLPSTKPYYLTFNNFYKKQKRTIDNQGRKSADGFVTGLVTDNNGAPLIGANVLVKGTSVGTITDIDGTFSVYMPKGHNLLDVSFTGYNSAQLYASSDYLNIQLSEGELLEEVVVTGYGGTSDNSYRGQAKKEKGHDNVVPLAIERSVTSINYDLTTVVTLESSEEGQSILIRKEQVDVEYKYKAYPKVDKYAFLTALVKDWNSLEILEGVANIYINNRYIGQTKIGTETVNGDAEKVLSLGKDREVYIERILQKGYTKRQNIGNNKIETRKWKLSLANNKRNTIEIIVEDQYPVSSISDIKVELLEKGTASNFDDFGKLIWTETLAAGDSKDLHFGYKVKSSKNKRLIVD